MEKKFQHITYIFFLTLLFHACSGDVLFHTKPCEEGMIRQGNACISEATNGDTSVNSPKNVSSTICKDPDLNKLQKGETVTLCDGSLGEGKLFLASEVPVCSQDGQQDCLTKNKFKAIDISQLEPTKIANGTTILGIVGTLRPYKQCRNYSALSTFDSSYPPSHLGSTTTFVPANVSTAGDSIIFSNPHGLVTNSTIRFTSSNTLPAPLVTNTTYYAIYQSTTAIQLASIVNGAAIDLTTSGVGTHTALDAPDNTAQYFDTIDDHNNGQASSPSSNPWSNSEYLCDASNFVNVTSSSSPLLPSGLTPANGTQPFTQIWQDQLSGVYISNILLVARNWSDAVKTCESLNNASAGNGWRLPTHKELAQLYINGITKVPLSGGSTNSSFWSSTGVSNNTPNVWAPNLTSLAMPSSSRGWTAGFSALCIR